MVFGVSRGQDSRVLFSPTVHIDGWVKNYEIPFGLFLHFRGRSLVKAPAAKNGSSAEDYTVEVKTGNVFSLKNGDRLLSVIFAYGFFPRDDLLLVQVRVFNVICSG